MQEILLGLGLKRQEESEGLPFKGEIIASPELLGTAIASQIGLAAGTVQNDGVGWLVFDFEGKTLLVAKQTFRRSVSWDHIHARGAVFGTATVTIQGDTYKVRLLKGAASDPISGVSGQHDPEQTWGSEWNRLMYPLVPNPVNTPTHPVSQEGIRYGAFADYTEVQLNMGNSGGDGRLTWCQESSGVSRVGRGSAGLSSFGLNTSSNSYSGYGWRPVLELIRTTGEPQDLFLGEVTTDQLITGDALAAQIGLTAGTAQNTNEPWLQFLTKEGQILYVAKKPYRYSVTWDQIHAVNAVYGERIITVGDKRFKLRLLKGAASDPISGGSGHDPEQSWGSEWNRLLYPLVPNPTNTPTHPLSQEGIRFGEWANYTEVDLGITTGNGRYTWCQESSRANRVYRGNTGLSGFHLRTSSYAALAYGWRPVLELVP